MYTEKLQKIGLSKNQSEVYALLISQGALKGSDLTKKVSLSRQLVYKVLDELIALSLVEKNKKSGSAGTFAITHPSALQNLLLTKEEKIKNAQKELAVTIDSLTSEYNLSSGKPGVQFFEGVEGVQKVLNDTLVSKQCIYTYLDFDTVEKYVKKINEIYVKNRKEKGIYKKILTIDRPGLRERLKKYDREITEIRIITGNKTDFFSSAMEIYDNKVSYITFKDKILTATKIQDSEIYKMHKILFESLWEKSERIQ